MGLPRPGVAYPNSSGPARVVPRPRSLDIRDFLPAGTPLDGSVDVGPSIRTAIQAAGSKGLYFAPGTYLFKALPVTMQTPAGMHVWADPGTVTILFDTTVAGEFREFARNNGDEQTWENITVKRNSEFPAVMFPVQNKKGFTLRRVTLDGQRDIYTSAYCHGLQLGVNSTGTADDICVDRCVFTKLSYGLFQTNGSVGTTRNMRFTNCRFVSNYNTDLEFNNPNGVMTGVRVGDCTFLDNQATGTGSGFAVGLAFVQDAKIRGNTITGYNNEAIHVEDHSSDVTIDDNSISQCGTMYTGVIQVISGSSAVRVTNNRISTIGNQTTITALNFLAGGSGLTPGGRPGVAPNRVIVQGNSITVGEGTRALYAESVLYLTITGNQFYGSGNVVGGFYAGPYCYALQIYTGTHTTITGNLFFGFTYGIVPQAETIGSLGAGSTVGDNIFRNCFLGLPLVNSDSATITGNMFHTCEHSMVLGQASGTNASVLVSGNLAFGCTNPMSIYGTTTVTTAADAVTGSGQSLAVTKLKNTLPVGTVVYFPGGPVFTVTTPGTFSSELLVGTLSAANVSGGQTGTAYLPYSADLTQNRTITDNADDFYGSAGFGVRIATVAADYRVLGYEGLILVTAGGITITLPPAANHGGMVFRVKNTTGSAVTIGTVSGNVEGAATSSLTGGTARSFVSDRTTWWIIS